MLSKIVVPLDLGPTTEEAISPAAVLARQAGATLELLHVVPPRGDATQAAVQLTEIAQRHGVKATSRVVSARHVPTGIRGATNSEDVAVCIRTSARRSISEMILGSVSEDLVRESSRPVLLVGPNCQPPPPRYESIVVALDGSERAERILPVVTDWSQQLDARPWLFQVLPDWMPLESGEPDVNEAAYVRGVAEGLANISAVDAAWDVAHDRDAAKAIEQFTAGRRAPIIALTTHGRSGMSRVALGSVAFAVAHRAEAPVLLLRTAEELT